MGDRFDLGALDWNAPLGLLMGLGVKSFLLLAITCLIVLRLRRASAARRHLVWMLGLGALALLPLLALLMPRWVLPVLPEKSTRSAVTQTDFQRIRNAADTTPDASNSLSVANSVSGSASGTRAGGESVSAAAPNYSTTATPPRAALPPAFWILMAWLAGAAAILLYQLAGVFALRRWTARHPEITDLAIHRVADLLCDQLSIRRAVSLRFGGEASMPMAAGFNRARVFLPNEACNWPGEKLRAVLAHELAHVKRRDCLTQDVARLIAAFYWFNPLAWLAVRRLRIERERACDDLVLRAGESPASYATQLVDIAREMCVKTPVAAAAVMMVRPSQIEGRVRSVLAPGVNRRGVSKPFLLFGGALVLLIAATISGMILSGPSRQQAIDQSKDFYQLMWSDLQQSWEKTEEIGDQGNDPMRPILVIDLEASEFRLERPGGVRPHERIALPEGFDWELGLWNNDGMKQIDSPVRLRVRTNWITENGYRNKEFHGSMLGMLELRGTHQPTGQQFGMDIGVGGGGWHAGFTSSVQISNSGNEPVVSMYVDDAEYTAAQAAWAAARAETESGTALLQSAESTADLQQAWSQFRASLTGELRRHMESQGWQRVEFEEVNINNDLLRGNMRVGGYHRGGLFGRSGNQSLFGFGHGYDIEYLGGASWALMGRGGLWGDNLVLSGLGQQDAAQWDAEFEQALKFHREWNRHLYEWDAKFTATLTNGTLVEFIGFSESGHRDDSWWKPDGTPLDWQPFIIPEDTRPLHEKDGRRWVAVAYRVTNTEGSTSRSMPGSDGSGSGTAVDPWGGNIVYMNTSMEVGNRERFATDQQTAEFRFKHTDPSGNAAALTIRNLSLYPGRITEPVFEGDLLTGTRPKLEDYGALPPDIDPSSFSHGTFKWLQAMSDYLEQFDAWPDGDAHDPTVQGNLEEVVWKDIRDSDYYLERAAFADTLERQFLPLCKWYLANDELPAPAPMEAENYVLTLRKLFDESHSALGSEFPELSVRATENIMAPALDLMQQAVEKFHDPLEEFREGSEAAHREWIANRRNGTLAHLRNMQATQPDPGPGN